VASPVAHSLTAIVVYTIVHRRLPSWRDGVIWLYVVAANLPDFDFLPGLLIGDPERFHRGASHSLAFALVCGLAAYAFTRWREKPNAVGSSVLATTLVGSHVLIDWLTRDSSAPVGIPALWPLTSTHYSAPLHLFLNVERGNLDTLATWLHNLAGAGLEALALLPLIAMAWWWQRRQAVH
jgi:inner membrane protein